MLCACMQRRDTTRLPRMSTHRPCPQARTGFLGTSDAFCTMYILPTSTMAKNLRTGRQAGKHAYPYTRTGPATRTCPLCHCDSSRQTPALNPWLPTSTL